MFIGIRSRHLIHCGRLSGSIAEKLYGHTRTYGLRRAGLATVRQYSMLRKASLHGSVALPLASALALESAARSGARDRIAHMETPSGKDRIFGHAAELGFYFLFALFPTLFCASSVLGLVSPVRATILRSASRLSRLS
jgi:hypothetical protein